MSAEAETVAAQAYQVIAALAGDTGVYHDPAVTRALDYFSGIANGKTKPNDDFLPWTLALEVATGGSIVGEVE